MLNFIHISGMSVQDFIEKVKDKESGIRLMGFGHRVYKNFDPRVTMSNKAMGFPTNMFTVLFTIVRLPGWTAQWREMREDPKGRIGRPRQIYTGHSERDFVSLEQR
jgi:citrate synthase